MLKAIIAEHHTIDIYRAMKNITYMDDILAGNYTAGSLFPFNYKENIEIRIAIAGYDAASFEWIPGKEDPTIEVQRNRIESPMLNFQ
jgi:hypothetical protein